MLHLPTETVTMPYGVSFEAPLIYNPPPARATATETMLDVRLQRGTLSWIAGLRTQGAISNSSQWSYAALFFEHAAEALRFQAQQALARYSLEAGPSIWLVQPARVEDDNETVVPDILQCCTPLLVPLRMHLEELYEKLCRTPLPCETIHQAMMQTAQLRACTDFITG